MRGIRVLFSCLTVLFLVVASVPLLASEGYDQLYWIDAKGYCLHESEDQGIVLTSFIRYRQYSQEGDRIKPGYFQCAQDGVEMQLPVNTIKQIRLKTSPESFKNMIGSEKLKHLVLVLRDGRSFEVAVDENMGYSLTNHAFVELKYYNPVTRQYDFGGFPGHTIREITFE